MQEKKVLATFNIRGALVIRIGFWGILYFDYNKEPQNPILSIKAPIVGLTPRPEWIRGLNHLFLPVMGLGFRVSCKRSRFDKLLCSLAV